MPSPRHLQARYLGLPTALALAAAVAAGAAPEVAVTFRVNDAFVKDRMLAGVTVALAREATAAPFLTGTTDAQGSLAVTLEPGTYFASYGLRGYVPLAASETRVEQAGQVVTTTLSMMLETEGSPPEERRVRIILNWGSEASSQVKDADSHLVCACGAAGSHVFFQSMEHLGETHAVRLDVDDTDWGGPETVTLTNPPAGAYPYWVHDYSGGPGNLAGSQVVVRVLVGDVVAGEYRPPAGAVGLDWRPFRELRIGADLSAQIVPFAPEELAAGEAFAAPAGFATTEATSPAADPPAAEPAATSSPNGCVKIVALVAVFLIVARMSGRRAKAR